MSRVVVTGRIPQDGLDLLGALHDVWTRLSLDELIETSDIVSLHVQYSPATHHLIGAEQLRSPFSTDSRPA